MDTLTVTAIIARPVEEVWQYFTQPQHIIHWNSASPEWSCPSATNNLYTDGNFNYRMEAKDGSYGFDFYGIYEEVTENEKIVYLIEDGRKVEVIFRVIDDNTTELSEIFEPEFENPYDIQRQGWQAILDNFKKYAEEN